VAQASPIQMVVCELYRQASVLLGQAEQHLSGLPVFLFGGPHFKRLCKPKLGSVASLGQPSAISTAP
jgi:hypothetical protein